MSNDLLGQVLDALNNLPASSWSTDINGNPIEAMVTKWRVLETVSAALEAAQPVPPWECQTEGEKNAFAFGWWKALESVRPAGVPTEELAVVKPRHPHYDDDDLSIQRTKK